MRVHVKFEDNCLVIPCKNEKSSIQWLLSEAVDRFRKSRSPGSSQLDVMSSSLYLPNGGGMLWLDDAIEDVLENDVFVELKSTYKAMWTI